MVMPFSTFMTQMVTNYKYTGKIIINIIPFFISLNGEVNLRRNAKISELRGL